MIEPLCPHAFVFAGHDLLFEIDSAGTVMFAIGAGSRFSSNAELTGRPAADLFQPKDGRRFTEAVRSLSPGGRAGPLTMNLRSGEEATLWMLYLPEIDRIACSLVKPGTRSALPGGGADAETGLASKDAFLAAAARAAGGEGTLSLVDIPSLLDACANLGPHETALLMSAIGTRMKSMGATIAARLSKTSFGVVADDERIASGLSARVRHACFENGIAPLEVDELQLSLSDNNLSAEQTILALHHVVDRFAGGQIENMPGAFLAHVFETMMSQTLARAQSFASTVEDGAFDFVFEPIVNLKTGFTSHYEALTRFEPDKSPADTICFAENLGLAAAFDLAVAVKAFGLFEQNPPIAASIAINLSGPSIEAPASFAMLHALFTKKRAFAGSVRIEITETAKISDLPAANNAIQSLRQMGYRVGIDDFGSGAASLQYFQSLHVDFVKFDGALIKRLGRSARDDALLKNVLASCAELNIETVAEWINSRDLLQRCVDIGFRYGQGRQFGDALKILPFDPGNARAKGRHVAAH